MVVNRGPSSPSRIIADQSFPKSHRLRTKAEFDAVFAVRRSVSDAALVVYARRNDVGHARLGLAVSRKVGGAVDRNRWKRALREAFRTADGMPPLDLVCVPRASAPPKVASLRVALMRLAGDLDHKLKR